MPGAAAVQAAAPAAPLSVTVVICTHNGAARLPATLEHLALQDTSAGTFAEVLIVDNASTDKSAEAAQAVWPSSAAAPLRVLQEARLGLTQARLTGWRAARADVVAFVDDDNWLPARWIRAVSDIMSAHPRVSACGGPAEPVFEATPPAWYERFRENFAVGPQSHVSGDVTETRPVLWGAGLAVRRPHLEALWQSGFQTWSTDRRGAHLAAGGDTELCLALVRSGGRLWYDERLGFRHFMPAARLRWEYLRRLYRGFGAATVVTDLYRYETFLRSGPLANAIRTNWLYRGARTAGGLLARPGTARDWLIGSEGSADVLWFEQQLGRLGELFRWRGRYASAFRDMAARSWPALP